MVPEDIPVNPFHVTQAELTLRSRKCKITTIHDGPLDFQRKSRQIQKQGDEKKEANAKQSIVPVPVLTPNMTSTRPDLNAEDIAHVVKNRSYPGNRSGIHNRHNYQVIYHVHKS